MIQLTSKKKLEYDIIGLLFPLISLIKEREGWDRIAQYFLCQMLSQSRTSRATSRNKSRNTFIYELSVQESKTRNKIRLKYFVQFNWGAITTRRQYWSRMIS